MRTHPEKLTPVRQIQKEFCFLLKIGLDVGSTTLKSVVLNHQGQIVYKKYERHFSQIAEKVSCWENVYFRTSNNSY